MLAEGAQQSLGSGWTLGFSPEIFGGIMRRKSLVVVALVALFAAGVLWYFASPAYALSQLRDAAESGDKAQLEERIDFPKVKESLKSQFSALMMKEVAKAKEEEGGGFAAFGAMMAMAMIQPMIDGLVTPEAMSNMIKEGKLKRAKEAAPAPAAKPVDWSIDRDGLDRFRAIPTAEKGEEPPALVFERHGLGWKLADIDLPDELPAKQ